jgi:SAM-dependent methyltransferase
MIVSTEVSFWREFWDEQASLSDEEKAVSRDVLHLHPYFQRILDTLIGRLLDFRPDDVVLDAGCGTGLYIRRYANGVKHCEGFDLSPVMVERARILLQASGIENAGVSVGDLREMSRFETDSKTKILCRGVLQCLNDNDTVNVLREFRRITRDGGKIILHVKNGVSPYGITLKIGRWVRALFKGRKPFYEAYRSCRWYRSALKDVGVEVIDQCSYCLYPVIFPRVLKRWILSADLFLLKMGIRHRVGVEFWIVGRVGKEKG